MFVLLDSTLQWNSKLVQAFVTLFRHQERADAPSLACSSFLGISGRSCCLDPQDSQFPVPVLKRPRPPTQPIWERSTGCVFWSSQRRIWGHQCVNGGSSFKSLHSFYSMTLWGRWGNFTCVRGEGRSGGDGLVKYGVKETKDTVLFRIQRCRIRSLRDFKFGNFSKELFVCLCKQLGADIATQPAARAPSRRQTAERHPLILLKEKGWICFMLQAGRAFPS